MKKLLFLALIAVSCTGQRFQFIQATYSPETYYKLVSDTVVITKSTLIAGITIDAIDTVRVKGKVTYLTTDSTVVSDYVKINPGDSKGIGFNWDVRLDSVTIINDGKAQYWITPVR